MLFYNILQDINHDFASILQAAARWCDDFVEAISSVQIFEYEGIRNNKMYYAPTTVLTPIYNHNNINIEESWYIVNDVDWSYDDSRRLDSSVSI